MRKYAYQTLTNPSDKDLNELGATGWRVCTSWTTTRYWRGETTATSTPTVFVLMERSGDVAEPQSDRI